MTNPNPTETYRWIPAVEKPGGLVFGDVVRPTSVKNGQYAFLSIVHINMMPYYRAAGFAGTIYNWPTEHTDLLVRIDPPAKLPESTDAFRRGVQSAVDAMLEKASDARRSASEHAKHGRWEDSDSQHDGALALKLTAEMICQRYNIPTPTEAADGE